MNGEFGTYAFANINATIGCVLATGCEGTAVVEHQENGRGVGGMSMDKGVDAAVVEG